MRIKHALHEERLMRSLYLSYFGLREPLVQTQVLPYLRELSRGGIGVGLLTFEPARRTSWSRSEAREWCDRLQADGIRWFSLPYHKLPSLPATTYDIAVGGWMAARFVRRHGYDVVHARAHVAAAMGAIAKRLTGCRLIFDIRGFNPEEYVDAGVWPPDGLNYRLAKRVERRLLSTADGFVVLTERARDILFPGCFDTDSRGRPIEVIPCCVDMGRFQAVAALPRGQIRQDLGIDGRRVLVYLGALGGFYLTEEMAELMAVAHRQDASTFSMILTQSNPDLIVERLKRLRVPRDCYFVRRIPHHEVPRYLRAANIALSFIKPSHSKLASSPTKIAEYLASGLPIICNAGIGDLDEVIEGDGVGALIREFNADHYDRVLRAAEGLLRDGGASSRSRSSAARRFDLERIGGERYCRLYSRLMKPPERALAVTEVSAWTRIRATCRAFNWVPRLPRRGARLSIGSLLVVLATYALEALPYSTSLIEHVERADVNPGRPTPDFSLGSLRWQVSHYAIDPVLEPLRKYYRAHADGKNGLDAARLITEGIASRSPLGEPSQEFVNAGFNPVSSFLLQLGGEPGHCTTRSGSVAAVLLASGIPARVFQIIPLGPDGHLRLADGHNVLEVWDDQSGWSMVDPILGGMLVGDRAGSRSASEKMQNPGAFTAFPHLMNTQYIGNKSYYHDLGPSFCVLFPEPWLYVRSGNRSAPRPFRGRYVCVGPGHWQLGPAQKSLIGFIGLSTIYVASELVLLLVVAPVRRLVG
jgi:glycosyltransferase involved in cell wall biosynthesis